MISRPFVTSTVFAPLFLHIIFHSATKSSAMHTSSTSTEHKNYSNYQMAHIS